MFLFGILSTPLPYLLMAIFYVFGFAAGMFHKETAEVDLNAQIEIKNIQVESPSKSLNETQKNFLFQDYKVEKKVVDCTLKTQPPSPPGREKLIYFVHDIKIPHSSISDFYFCRPPPVNS